jgi:ABC-type oligopeptide transport system substrate-binding subunit
MTRLTHSRQRSIVLLAIVLIVLLLLLAACGTHASASSSSTTTNPATIQQPQSGQPAQSGTGSSSVQGTDQQVQSILKSLNSAQNDVNNSDAAASQDSGQQP